MNRNAPQHRLNPRKLLLSKWTAVQPQNREKHFLVSELFCDEQGHVLQLELQAEVVKISSAVARVSPGVRGKARYAKNGGV
jgi:tryptophan-rich hypothetical protein